jgi:hypothetical protein
LVVLHADIVSLIETFPVDLNIEFLLKFSEIGLDHRGVAHDNSVPVMKYGGKRLTKRTGLDKLCLIEIQYCLPVG